MSRVGVIVQARMGSSRFPGKVLEDVHGTKLLEIVLRRLKVLKGLDEVVVATTTHSQDDPIVELSQSLGVAVFRGSEQDVLSRYYFAAEEFELDTIVRVTSDCPLVDPHIIQQMLQKYKSLGTVDYFSNAIVFSYPHGLDVEITHMNALATAHHESRDADEREHVLGFIAKRSDRFRLYNFFNPDDPKGDKQQYRHRWTVDYPEDLEFVRAVFKDLEKSIEDFGWRDVLSIVQKSPEISEINAARGQRQSPSNPSFPRFSNSSSV